MVHQGVTVRRVLVKGELDVGDSEAGRGQPPGKGACRGADEGVGEASGQAVFAPPIA